MLVSGSKRSGITPKEGHLAECSLSPDFAYLSRAHLPTCPLHFSPTGLRVPPHKGPCFRVHCPAGLACVPSSQPLLPPGGCLVTTSFFAQKSHSSGKPFLMPIPEPRPDGAQSPTTCLLRVYREGLRNPWTHQAESWGWGPGLFPSFHVPRVEQGQALSNRNVEVEGEETDEKS